MRRHRFIMAVRDPDAQPLSARAAPAFVRQTGKGSGLVDEDESLGIETGAFVTCVVLIR
jgi:hypothetical protein